MSERPRGRIPPCEIGASNTFPRYEWMRASTPIAWSSPCTATASTRCVCDDCRIANSSTRGCAGPYPCLLYTSDAADDLLCVDLGGRRIIKKKKTIKTKQQ